MATGITKKELMAKARGFTLSIEKMDEKQRANTPSGKFADDYNKLLNLTSELYPALNPLLPPPVKTRQSSTSSTVWSEQTFAEINTFCEQIFQLLSEQD